VRYWIEFFAAAGVCSAIALASTASFGQGAELGGAPPSIGAPTYDPYVAGYYYRDDWPRWQYHGGPKSTSTTDTYEGPHVYWYEGPNYGGMVIPR
jgi:hypothetical protein